MKKPWICPRPVALVIALTAYLALRAPAAAQFSLASQNCLHLGQGPVAYQQNKEAILRGVFGNYDVTVLQEVMAQANVGNVTPGSHYFVATAVQGPTTYKEAYAFLVRTGLNVATTAITGVGGYARPPAGILLGAGGAWTWVIDYHAVYGRSIAVRRAEVGRTQAVYQGFQALVVNGQTFRRAVMAGDWNLGAQDVVFQQFAIGGWPINVLPAARTSLKRNGGPSQPYDHFLWDTTAVTVVTTQVIAVPNPPGSTLGWRQQVSDHLGISATVQ
jgi:hypothetical protein